MLKSTQEKFENYWKKFKFKSKSKSVNKWIIGLKSAEIIGGLIPLLSLIWPFIPFTDADKHSSLTAAFALAGFLITSISSSVNDLWFKPEKDKLSAESVISLQETETKKRIKILKLTHLV